MSTRLTEADRLQLLADYGAMDSQPDDTLDDIVKLASAVCEMPIALLSLVDDTRQWFKSRVGFAAEETPRDQAFSAHAIAADTDALFVVPDARRDPRFEKNPLVVGNPNVVFYAGAPLVVEGGAKLGTLCVIDRVPRTLTATQELALTTLSKLAVERLRIRRDETVRDAANARLDAVLSGITEAVVATDRDGRVTFLNPVAETLARVSSKEALGKPLPEVLDIVDAATFAPANDLVDLALRDARTVARARPALVRRAGAIMPIHDSAVPTRNARGEITGAVLVVRDITESEQARKRLEAIAEERAILLAARLKAERELEDIFQLSVDLLCVVRDGHFVRVNPAFTTILGWTAAELVGRRVADLVHPEDATRAEAQREIVAHGDPLRGFEARYRHKDGAWRWLSWSATQSGGTAYAVGRDVTDEKLIAEVRAKLAEEQRAAREAAEQARRAMDQFLATVSHELRTPLSAMLGWTRLLRSGQIAESDYPKALATIERNAVAQTQLIDDLLDVSRIIAGKMRLDLAPVDLVQVIEAAIDVVRPAADARKITLRTLLDPAATHVTGDASRLQQVLWNMLSNAVKFTPQGGRVEIRLVRVASSIEIVISDNGAGIRPELLVRIFDRFKQVDGGMTRAHGGLGLGLAIVKSIMELHGGTVRAESGGLGTGTSFTLTLPLALVRPERAARVVSEHPRIDGPRTFECPPEVKGARILVVDDEDDARDLLAAILERCGAVVTSAGSVAEAFQAFRTTELDVVVSDLGMAKEDGYALVRQIRQLPQAEGGRTPVIALTAYARTEDRTRVLRAGFNIHVAKPIEPSELLAVIASFLERRSDY